MSHLLARLSISLSGHITHDDIDLSTQFRSHFSNLVFESIDLFILLCQRLVGTFGAISEYIPIRLLCGLKLLIRARLDDLCHLDFALGSYCSMVRFDRWSDCFDCRGYSSSSIEHKFATVSQLSICAARSIVGWIICVFDFVSLS
jgi:hypothetical protein